MHPSEGKKCLGLEVAPAPPQTAIAHTRQSQAGQTALLGCHKLLLEVHSLEAAPRNKGVPCSHCTEKELVSYLAGTAHTFFLADEADVGTGH